jgi:anaerobic ribonucleoside-triphosphate reductase activating protein
MTVRNNKSDLLNVHDVLVVSYANGPGPRAVIWVQGCSKRCPGCSNPLTHSHRPHVLFAPERLAESILTIPTIEGLTVTGGEPLEQAAAVCRLCQLVRKSGLTVMVFTGWEYESICQSSDRWVRDLLGQIDILVDGPFIKCLSDKNLLWRGSSNQQIRFLTDRYSPDVLQNSHTQVEAVLQQGAKGILMTGFPDDFDIAVLTTRLSSEAGIVLEPVERECNKNTILGGKNHDCIRKNC